MAQATLRISKDKDFFSCETPDNSDWEVEQIEEGGVNLIYDDDPRSPAYLVITEDFTGPLPKNKIYQLLPLDTEVISGVDFEDENDEDEEEPEG